MDKKQLRREMRLVRDGISQEEHKRKSRQIIQRVIGSKEWETATECLLFASIRSEVDTKELIQKAFACGKKVYLPRVTGGTMEFYSVQKGEELQEGSWGIQEPKGEAGRRWKGSNKENTLMIMPGLAFDQTGGRLGYGGGFYDRFLENVEVSFGKQQLCKMGICFQCQLLENDCIPREPQDYSPDLVVTEEKIYIIRNISIRREIPC